MHPQNDLLTKFTALAKNIIYNADRMKKFMGMMGTPEGAVIAVHTVLGTIEQAKPVPPEIAKNLGVNAYLIMVDMAQNVTGKQASPDVMKKVIGTILTEVNQTHGQSAPAPQAPAQPMGIINRGAPA